MRLGELSQLTVVDVRLDDKVPHIDLPARVTKNGEDAIIPLRADLLDMLRRRVANLAPSSPLYPIPNDLIKRFNADCRRAGIPKRDERNRTVDIHALRTTFGTWLARSGVAPRTAQALMRHSVIKLTMSVYTDPKLLDTAAVVGSIPSVAPISLSVAPDRPLAVAPNRRISSSRRVASVSVAPAVAPTPGISGAPESSAGMIRCRARLA